MTGYSEITVAPGKFLTGIVRTGPGGRLQLRSAPGQTYYATKGFSKSSFDRLAPSSDKVQTWRLVETGPFPNLTSLPIYGATPSVTSNVHGVFTPWQLDHTLVVAACAVQYSSRT